MPERSDERPPRPEDFDRQPRGSATDEPRDFEAQVSDITADEEGSFFHDSSSDVEINTHGSER
jgi:hypothetical protein